MFQDVLFMKPGPLRPGVKTEITFGMLRLLRPVAMDRPRTYEQSHFGQVKSVKWREASEIRSGPSQGGLRKGIMAHAFSTKHV